ncbi:hypothetical protein Drose_23125 [Dactylosporangium roseum]|uniref:Uncharacterized protein n=1 Tax=Dactylosporangium roseum TaxID=47989 RepID=A0ABY5YZ97_9ACTN|nr:hypothetical protein [Dactylosporangium roseum]UWZ34140.1 hypothetical protein Drose_23125 [Dactylosporangium roseum]
MPNAAARLCDELLGIAPLQLRPTRDHVVHLLFRRLPAEPRVKRSDDPRTDLTAVVAACLEQRGALRDLIEIVGRFAPGDPALDRLTRMTDFLFPDELLTRAERGELLAVLGDANRAVVVSAYRDSVPLDAHLPGAGETADLVTRLESLVGIEGRPPPLLAFVMGVARQLDPAVAGRLRDWTGAVGRRLRLDPDVLGSRPEAGDPSGDTALHLIVIVRPDAMSDDQYLLSVWLQHGSRAERPLMMDDRLRSVGEVATALRTALDTAAKESDAPLTVEMVLPRALLNEPVDQWPSGAVPRGLGIRHTVVVRSLDRLRLPQTSIDAWHHRWRLLAGAGDRLPSSAVEVSAPAGPRQWQEDHAPDGTGGPVVLALDAPLPDAGRLQNDVFTAAIRAGVPALVWSRHPALSPALLDTVLALARRVGVAQLPAEVRRIRVRAAAVEPGPAVDEDLGRHLALVWDDADRIPVEFRAPPFRAPR